MAAKRRVPPKKQPSPPPPPHPDEDVEEDERSGSEEEPAVERDRKPLESETSGDDDEGGGDESGDDDSESVPEQLAPNKTRVLAAAADEDDDDGENDESEEEDSETEEEQPNSSPQNSAIARPANANANPSDKKSVPASESEEEDSESEEEQTNPSQQNSAIARPANANGNSSDKKSVPASEPEEEDSESEEERMNPNSAVTRPANANGNPSDKKSVPASKSGKDAAAPPKAATGETAKKLFQRIWSDEDQIALLQGMVDYVDAKGKDPLANIGDFWLFISEKLSFPVTKSQLMTKIRNVKNKYRSNQRKETAFSKAYDAEVFELSKKVWGAAKKNSATENGKNGGGKKRKSGPSDKEAVWDSADDKLVNGMAWEDGIFNLCEEHLGLNEYLATKKINSMEGSERKSLQLRWKKVKTEEVRCFENRMSLEFDSLETIFLTPPKEFAPS